MSEVEFPIAPANQRVIYRSFLLRLRQTTTEGENSQQFFVKDIQTAEEFYFTHPDDVLCFLSNGADIGAIQRNQE